MRVILLLGLAFLGSCASVPQPAGKQVLIFSHTTGFRHESIAVARPALAALVQEMGAQAVMSEDPAVFADLHGFDAVVLLSNTTDRKKPESEWLTGARRDGLQAFVRSGGGIVGIHAAADSHSHWPWYTRMIGGQFERHPQGTPEGEVTIVDRDHPATRSLPQQVRRSDEWYYYQDQDPQARLLATFDPASIGERDANPNPIAWAKTFEGGRVFYTGLGHTSESYAEPFFLDHVRGGLRWALRLED